MKAIPFLEELKVGGGFCLGAPTNVKKSEKHLYLHLDLQLLVAISTCLLTTIAYVSMAERIYSIRLWIIVTRRLKSSLTTDRKVKINLTNY